MEKEETIISKLKNGEANAIDELYQNYSEQVYNTALSYVQNIPDAEEVTQDVFVKIYKNAHSFKGDSKLSTWIYRITVNTSLNKVKSKKKFFFLGLDQAHKESNFVHPGVLMERKEDAQQLYRVIQGLPDNQKTCFILSYIEDLPRKEIAQIMNLSLKAVESLLQRAKKNLQKNLINHYPNRRK